MTALNVRHTTIYRYSRPVVLGSFLGAAGSYLGMTVAVTIESESAGPRQRRFA